MLLKSKVTYIINALCLNGDFIKLRRPRGRPPTDIISSIFYWIHAVVGTVLMNPTLLMGIVGGIGGYYIGHSFEMIIVGFVIGSALGFVIFEGRRW